MLECTYSVYAQCSHALHPKQGQTIVYIFDSWIFFAIFAETIIVSSYKFVGIHCLFFCSYVNHSFSLISEQDKLRFCLSEMSVPKLNLGAARSTSQLASIIKSDDPFESKPLTVDNEHLDDDDQYEGRSSVARSRQESESFNRYDAGYGEEYGEECYDDLDGVSYPNDFGSPHKPSAYSILKEPSQVDEEEALEDDFFPPESDLPSHVEVSPDLATPSPLPPLTNIKNSPPILSPPQSPQTVLRRRQQEEAIQLATCKQLLFPSASTPVDSPNPSRPSSVLSNAIETVQVNVSKSVPVKRRRTVQKLNADPEKLALCDLLFYNPPETDLQREHKLTLAKLENDDDDEVVTKAESIKKRRTTASSRNSRSNSIDSQVTRRSLRSDSKDAPADDDSQHQDTNNNTEVNKADESDETAVLQPAKSEHDDSTMDSQASGMLTLDESGNIVLTDPNALLEADKETKKKVPIKMKSSTTYTSFRRKERCKNSWTPAETTAFYSALELVGTDFSLMEAAFFKDTGRDRKQLKSKFKREEKFNRDYVDQLLFKSLRNRSRVVHQGLLNSPPSVEEIVPFPSVLDHSEVIKENLNTV